MLVTKSRKLTTRKREQNSPPAPAAWDAIITVSLKKNPKTLAKLVGEWELMPLKDHVPC
jgi:hypothetical protein